MKKVSIISLIALVAIVISSCGSSNNVVSNHGISKRKYTKGYFFQRNSNIKSDEAKVKDAELKEGTTIAKAEKTEGVSKNVSSKVAEDGISSKPQKEKKVKTEKNSNSGFISTSHDVASNLYVSEDKVDAVSTNDPRQDNSDGLNWSVTENQPSATGESIKQSSASTSADTSTKNSGKAAGGVHIVILVILAIFIPPLAVFLYEGATSRFWIDLILAILGFGLGFGLLGGVYGLLGLIAVIYALLIVLEVI